MASKKTTETTETDKLAPSSSKAQVKFCVLAHGWVFVGRVTDEDDHILVLKDACVVRRWGTKRGIGQIIMGPTNDTILDPIPGDVRFERQGILFSWASGNHAVWNSVLDRALEGPIEKSGG